MHSICHPSITPPCKWKVIGRVGPFHSFCPWATHTTHIHYYYYFHTHTYFKNNLCCNKINECFATIFVFYSLSLSLINSNRCILLYSLGLVGAQSTGKDAAALLLLWLSGDGAGDLARALPNREPKTKTEPTMWCELTGFGINKNEANIVTHFLPVISIPITIGSNKCST